MLLFYNRANGAAAIGSHSANGLTTTKEFRQGSFGNWTHVVLQNSSCLFYNRNNGAGAIGRLTSNDFVTTKEFGEGSFGTWTHVINTGAGCFFYNQMTGAAAIGSFDAGNFTTTGSLSNGSLGEWTHIVADGTTMLFYNRLNGSAAIGTVTPTGLTTTTSFEPGSFGVWTHVINQSSTILFYNRDRGAGAIGTLTPTGLKTNTSYKSGSFDHWTHIVADGARMLFYNQDTGEGAIGTLTTTAFTTNASYQPGQFSRWTHVVGRSSSGPEEQELKLAVLLCRWGQSSTVLSADFYHKYMFNLSAEHGLGRFWFHQSGGQLRLAGHVTDWISLSKAPSDTSIANNRTALAELAIADAQRAGWRPGDERGIVVIVACHEAKGVTAGGLGDLMKVAGIDRSVLVLHGDSSNWISTKPNSVDAVNHVLNSNFRFDFNAHELGHMIGHTFSFNHAFGPNGPYDHPYCVMAAMTYGGRLRTDLYDMWQSSSKRPPEEHTKGVGLSGATRAACGWARRLRLKAEDLQQGRELYLAHLGDHTSTLPQVIECPGPKVNGVSATFTIEFRSPLAESDQRLPATLVLCQREGSTWSSNGTWKERSSTFRSAAVIPSTGTLPSLIEPGVVRVEVLEVAPSRPLEDPAWLRIRGPAWIRIRLTK